MQRQAWSAERDLIASHEFELDTDRRRDVLGAYQRGLAGFDRGGAR